MQKQFFWRKQIRADRLLLALLAIVTWAGRFFSSHQFGLYYEDWGRIPVAMAWSWSTWFSYLAQLPGWLLKAEFEGRPLHPAAIHTFAFLGQQLGGLSAIYWIGCGIAVLNTWLFYGLLKRITSVVSFSLLGGLAFALFPTHTSQALLTITLGILPSLTLILLAFHLYLTPRRGAVLAAYALAFISIFWYEKFLLLFTVAPLLKPEWNRRSWREWLRHSVIVVAMLAGAVLMRKFQGESRVASLEATSFYNPLLSLVVGPLMTVNTFLKRPVQAIFSIQGWEWLPLSLFFLIIASAIYYTLIMHPDNAPLNRAGILVDVLRGAKSRPPHLNRLAIAGGLMLVLAYPLNFLDSPFIIEGRTSHIHVAAVVGGSLLWACLWSVVATLPVFAQRQKLLAALAGLYFTLLIAFGFTVQRDYVVAAQYQRSFWSQIVRLCPDMTKDTVILALPSVSRDFNQLLPIQPLRSGHFPEFWATFIAFQTPGQLGLSPGSST